MRTARHLLMGEGGQLSDTEALRLESKGAGQASRTGAQALPLADMADLVGEGTQSAVRQADTLSDGCGGLGRGALDSCALEGCGREAVGLQ